MQVISHKKRKPNIQTKFSLTKQNFSFKEFIIQKCINNEVSRADTKLQGVKIGANKHWEKTVFETEFASIFFYHLNVKLGFSLPPFSTSFLMNRHTNLFLSKHL